MDAVKTVKTVKAVELSELDAALRRVRVSWCGHGRGWAAEWCAPVGGGGGRKATICKQRPRRARMRPACDRER